MTITSRRHAAGRPGGDVTDSRPVRLAPLDILGLGLLGIRTRKVRAALSALGISIGIATLIVVTGIPASRPIRHAGGGC
jgi:putative ABC transport system permease protein